MKKGIFHSYINTDKTTRILGNRYIPKFYEESLFLYFINILFVIIIYFNFDKLSLPINNINFDLSNIARIFSSILSSFFLFLILTVLIFYPIYISTRLVFTQRSMTESEKPPLLWGGVISLAFIGIVGAIYSVYSILRLSIFESIQIKDIMILITAFITCFQSAIMIKSIKFMKIEKKVSSFDTKKDILFVEVFAITISSVLFKYVFKFDAISNILSVFMITNYIVQFLHQSNTTKIRY